MLKKFPVIKQVIRLREERKESRQLHEQIMGKTGQGRMVTVYNPIVEGAVDGSTICDPSGYEGNEKAGKLR